jgi:hypothetical protein
VLQEFGSKELSTAFAQGLAWLYVGGFKAATVSMLQHVFSGVVRLMKKLSEAGMDGFGEKVEEAIAGERRALLEHRLYGRLRRLGDLAVFMEHHVFAVWDFMSLLKALQARLTCTSVPWLPQGNAEVRRLVNEIVLGEESDALPSGGAASHFELYLQAMREAGADTAQIDLFIRHLESGQLVSTALEQARVPSAVGAFVQHTFDVIEQGRPHEIAAAFTYGREDLIPEMFTQLVHGLERQFPGKLKTLRYYLDRHIELDGDEHGEMGRQMVELLCGRDPVREQEAVQAAVAALRARIQLWDGIALALEN